MIRSRRSPGRLVWEKDALATESLQSERDAFTESVVRRLEKANPSRGICHGSSGFKVGWDQLASSAGPPCRTFVICWWAGAAKRRWSHPTFCATLNRTESLGIHSSRDRNGHRSAERPDYGSPVAPPTGGIGNRATLAARSISRRIVIPSPARSGRGGSPVSSAPSARGRSCVRGMPPHSSRGSTPTSG